MNSEVVWGVVFSVIGGLAVDYFFQLIKYRDSLNSKYPVPITAYGELTSASNYMSVSQYLSGGRRKWVNYFLFRILPPLIIFILLAGLLDRYLEVKFYTPYVLLAGIVSLIPRDLLFIFKARLISEKILHVLNVLIILSLSVLIGNLAQNISFGFIAPSVNGLIDNLWSSLMVAILVIFYIRATNMGQDDEDSKIKDITVSNYVVSSYVEIKDKYDTAIIAACTKHKCSKQLLYSVLIYENMNRPAWIRIAENLIVRIFKVKLTVGLGQVSSKVPLTNEQSIEKAAGILADTANLSDFHASLEAYNSSPYYTKSVYVVLEKLRIYESDV